VNVVEELKRATDASGRSILSGLKPKIRKEGQAILTELHAAREANDAKRFGEALHRLKGLALSFGARELAMQTATVRINATTLQLSALSTLFEQAMTVLETSLS